MKTKIYAIGQVDWDLWGFENGWFLTISENVQISDIPYFAHFDTFWFFSHNFQTNQSILSLEVFNGDKILEQLYAQRKFEKNQLRNSNHPNEHRPGSVGPNFTLHFH